MQGKSGLCHKANNNHREAAPGYFFDGMVFGKRITHGRVLAPAVK
jgi:hypothetical protein